MSFFYQIILLGTCLTLGACGGGGGSGAVSEETPATPAAPSSSTASSGNSTAGDKAPGSSATGEVDNKTPKDIRRFDGALGQSVLQYTVGSNMKTVYSDELLTHPQMKAFYFADQDMVFTVTRDGKEKQRSELRQYPEWSVADRHRLDATVTLTGTALNEYTWMQLHRKASTSVKPPLRLTWAKNQVIDGVSYPDYLVAVFYHPDSGYHKVPLMPRQDGPMTVSLEAYNYQVFISLNGSLVHVENVSDWAGHNCYFKLGVYASGSEAAYGQATVRYQEAAFSHSPGL
ncbi:putative alginate lyase AlyVOB [Alcanivorax hongdengensis A-11-3]|uniref:Putative alginate lyase AlyVOB n=1 Tax=Alcanivorax hongdengensis A-11-3 TaxID=1177179 RepID=L0WDF8_9GAMM|nr:polysaccharide lyase family 7 protein [Alcanivorax hongdengensis]EKF75036.1 putative alginate lyase AlyVOB [Alcanivorax hongdengensis A-11-3]